MKSFVHFWNDFKIFDKFFICLVFIIDGCYFKILIFVNALKLKIKKNFLVSFIRFFLQPNSSKTVIMPQNEIFIFNTSFFSWNWKFWNIFWKFWQISWIKEILLNLNQVFYNFWDKVICQYSNYPLIIGIYNLQFDLLTS